MSANIAELNRAILVLRKDGHTVRLVSGRGIAALWDIGPLKSVGYYEVLRRAEASYPVESKDADTSRIPLKEWPALSSGAFKSGGVR
jgi:hypothetical protein